MVATFLVSVKQWIVCIDLSARVLRRYLHIFWFTTDLLSRAEETWRQGGLYGERWCIGAIVESHISIRHLQDYHANYFNSKGWHSIIFWVVVGGKGLFWSVYTGQARRFSWCSSSETVHIVGTCWTWKPFSCLHHGVNVGYYILRDSVYPLQNCLMNTLLDHGWLTAEQQLLNKTVCRVQVVVENAFGRLKRWVVLTNEKEWQRHWTGKINGSDLCSGQFLWMVMMRTTKMTGTHLLQQPHRQNANIGLRDGWQTNNNKH